MYKASSTVYGDLQLSLLQKFSKALNEIDNDNMRLQGK